MDADGKIKMLKDKKGITLVVVALLIVVLVAFVGLSVDIGYMYVAKGQLQNAADSAALAGAFKLYSSTGTYQPFSARSEAVKFANANTAAVSPVSIDQNTTNDPNGDVVVGYWDGSIFSPVTPAGASNNAVKVTCRRTNETGTGISALNQQVAIYFGKVLGWSQMGAKASAIAVTFNFLPGPLVLCHDACGNPGNYFVNNNTAPPQFQAAWTVYNTAASVSDSTVKDYINGIKHIINDRCDTCLTTNNGTFNASLNLLKSQFSDVNWDFHNKTISGGIVTSWTIAMPIVDYQCTSLNSACPPYPQGSNTEPYHVWGWAKVTVSSVNASGSGNQKGFTATAITCRQCPNALLGLGGPFTTQLVK